MTAKSIKQIVGSLILSSIITSASSAADAVDSHPMKDALNRVFKSPPPVDFKVTNVSRQNYLKLIAGNVDFFIKCQNTEGAIIDPVSKGERQYSTPAFAVATALLVKEADRKDLLDPSIRAMDVALNALVDKKAADGHADFYIPLLVHAHRILKDVASNEKVAQWDALFKKIDPNTMYRADLRGMNWNVVSSSGELMRRLDGLVADDMKYAQLDYLETCLAGHMQHCNPLGLYEDPGVPMAYDAFTRLWLEDMNADSAYDGKLKNQIQDFLHQGGLSTLLLLSPSGEWIMGGRSALHNWTDLQVAAICEINASSWKKQGRDDVAGAFKRAAHLAFASAARWQRESGELNIIKNRAEPEKRFAYERYSNHSQYNLLPMAMLAIAYTRADESIVEKPMPSEIGGYVFDLRDKFHKIVASAGGYYVAIDTQADPHYNATGLQRVHRSNIAFPSLSDSCPPDRAYGPADLPKSAIAPGVQWKTANGQWIGLADFTGDKSEREIKSADLKNISATSDRTSFQIDYSLTGPGGDGATVTENYTLTKDGVTLESSVSGITDECRAQVPVLVTDGANNLKTQITESAATTINHGSSTIIHLPGKLHLEGEHIPNHNGLVKRGIVPLTKPKVMMLIELK